MDFPQGTLLWQLRNDALRLPEFATKKLWQQLLSKHVFCDQEWCVSTEQPPSQYDSLRRMDLLVEYFQLHILEVFLIGEKKKGKATHRDIADVEQQAFDRSSEFLQQSGREAVWVLTAYGPYARLWACRMQGPGFLEPVFPLQRARGQRSAYLDIQGNEALFMQTFNLMTQNPRPDAVTIETILAPLYDSGEGSSSAVQAIVVDINASVFVTIEKATDAQVRCRRLDGITESLGTQWAKAYILYEGEYKPCFAHTGQDGTQYWTWSVELDSEDKNKRGKGRKGKDGKGKDAKRK